MRKTVIVTGVSRRTGIGFAIAERLLAEGYALCVTHCTSFDVPMPGWRPTSDEVPDLLSDLRKIDPEVTDFEIDLSTTERFRELFDFAEEKSGPLYGIINNAAYSVDVDIDSVTEELLDKHYEVNLRAPILLIREFVRRFRARAAFDSGRVVGLSSGYQGEPNPGNLAYASTKAAMDRFTASVALELAPAGITVNSVDPGPTDTGWMPDSLRSDLLAAAPLGRLGVPEDAARLVAFLMSDEARWITGQVLHSRGGF